MNVRRVAGATPRMLLRQPDFWAGQPLFAATIAAGVVTVLALAPFTYGAAGGIDVVLLLLVHALAVWGGVIAAQALAALEVEKAIVSEIDRNGSELLRDVRSGQRARIDLDVLEQTVVPNNPADPPPAMIRLFQHICKEARDRRFESSVSVMEPYREEALEEIFKLQNLQKIALWLGILGTFVGLLVAINATDVTSGDFLGIVQKMFGGLVTAFSASLAGLQVAVFIALLLLLIRKKQERYFKMMENAVVTMLSLARNSINKDEFMAEFGQIAASIEDLTARVRAQTTENGRNLESTRRDMQEQTDAIRGGLERLGEARESFDGFLETLGTAQSEFIDDVRGIYDTISLKELSATLRASLADAGRLMSDSMGVATRQIENRLNDFNMSVDQLTNTLDAQARQSAEQSKLLAAQIASSTNESANAIRSAAARMQEVAAREQTMRSDLQELTRKIAMLSNSLDRVQFGQPSRPRTIRELMASLRW